MRVLLIAPEFYDYHDQMAQELRRRNHTVRFFAERPSRLIYSPAKKLPPRLRRKVFDRYLRNILKSVEGEKFDRVIIVRGEIIPPWFIEELRQRFPAARYVLYEWDSYRVTDYRHLIGAFDVVATFDSKDAEELNIGYLPLFHVPAYRLKDRPKDCEYDLVFVASYHETRYKHLLKIQSICDRNGLSLRRHLYINRFDYFKLRLSGQFTPARSDVTFVKIDQTDVVNMYRNSAGILDIENKRQTGLTMRSFEALATGRFLVTTNPMASILLAAHKDRIIEINLDQPEIFPEQLQHPPGWRDDLNEFSLENWLTKLIEC